MSKNIDLLSILLITSTICLWPIEITYFNFSLPFIVILNLIIFLLKLNKIPVFKSYQITLMCLIFFSLILSFLNLNCDNFLLKSTLSSIVFILIIFTYAQCFNSNSFDYKKVFLISGNISVLIIFIFVILEILFYEYLFSFRRYHKYGIYSGIFLEPSHLGISIIPGLISIAIFMNGLKKYLIIIFYILFFFIFSISNTLILNTIIIFSSIYLIKYKPSFIKLIFVFIVIFFILLLAMKYHSGFNERIESIFLLINNEYDMSLSLSSLIYIRGWFSAFYDISSYYGIGLGFNRLGCHINYYDPISNLLINHRYDLFLLNITDGSFLASKLISEFGFLSFFIFYFIIKNILKAYLMNMRFNDPIYKFYFVIFVYIFILIVTRSVSYFSSLWILVYIFMLQRIIVNEKNINFK